MNNKIILITFKTKKKNFKSKNPSQKSYAFDQVPGHRINLNQDNPTDLVTPQILRLLKGGEAEIYNSKLSFANIQHIYNKSYIFLLCLPPLKFP